MVITIVLILAITYNYSRSNSGPIMVMSLISVYFHIILAVKLAEYLVMSSHNYYDFEIIVFPYEMLVLKMI